MHHSGSQMIDPKTLFDKARIAPGMHIADFGCGMTGHIVFPAALCVGEKGLVYAVDILKEIVISLQKQAAAHRVFNIETVWGNIERGDAIAIPTESLDCVFLVNVLSQIKNRPAVLDAAKRFLKDKGRIVLVDWSKKGLPFGPKEEQFVTMDTVRAWAASNGCAVQETFTAGPFHTGIILFLQR